MHVCLFVSIKCNYIGLTCNQGSSRVLISIRLHFSEIVKTVAGKLAGVMEKSSDLGISAIDENKSLVFHCSLI